MVIFILIAGLVIKCTLSPDPLITQCASGTFREFGILASAGVLELIYEFRGVASVFQQKGGGDSKRKEE